MPLIILEPPATVARASAHTLTSVTTVAGKNCWRTAELLTISSSTASIGTSCSHCGPHPFPPQLPPNGARAADSQECPSVGLRLMGVSNGRLTNCNCCRTVRRSARAALFLANGGTFVQCMESPSLHCVAPRGRLRFNTAQRVAQ